jgi:hypothetical protein
MGRKKLEYTGQRLEGLEEVHYWEPRSTTDCDARGGGGGENKKKRKEEEEEKKKKKWKKKKKKKKCIIYLSVPQWSLLESSELL